MNIISDATTDVGSMPDVEASFHSSNGRIHDPPIVTLIAARKVIWRLGGKIKNFFFSLAINQVKSQSELK